MVGWPWWRHVAERLDIFSSPVLVTDNTVPIWWEQRAFMRNIDVGSPSCFSRIHSIYGLAPGYVNFRLVSGGFPRQILEMFVLFRDSAVHRLGGGCVLHFGFGSKNMVFCAR